MERGHATLKDVAARAGVSVATASRALSGDHPMARSTRERVLEAVEAVGYRRDRRGRQGAPLIAVVTTSLSHLVLAEIVQGVEEVSAGAGRLCTVSSSNTDADREVAVLSGLAEDERIGAVIAMGGVYPSASWRKGIGQVAGRLANRGIPFIFCGRSVRDLNIPGITILDYDNRGGAAAAVGLLLGRGHTRIAMIRGSAGFSTSDARGAGYLDALESYGIEPDNELQMVGERSLEFGITAAQSLLQARPDVTAVFGESDSIAMGVIRAAGTLGLTLPSELSVIGFDDQPWTAPGTVPALSTVHMPYVELGRRAARVALGVDPFLPAGGEVMFGTHVVVRESVGEPRTRRLDLKR